MSLSVEIFTEREKVSTNPCKQEDSEEHHEGEELLMNKEEFLRKRIDQELLFAKKNCRKNRGVALQALRRKTWYEKHLKYADCTVKAARSTHEHIGIVDKVNELITDITEEQDVAQDMSGCLYTPVSCEVDFDEEELLAELERLEKNLDEIVFEDTTEESIPCTQVSSTAASHPAKMEEDEGDLEYLLRWASEP